jgi:hypothetical protein
MPSLKDIVDVIVRLMPLITGRDYAVRQLAIKSYSQFKQFTPIAQPYSGGNVGFAALSVVIFGLLAIEMFMLFLGLLAYFSHASINGIALYPEPTTAKLAVALAAMPLTTAACVWAVKQTLQGLTECAHAWPLMRSRDRWSAMFCLFVVLSLAIALSNWPQLIYYFLWANQD